MPASFQPPYLGAAYYPEDWPLEQIDRDIALMKQAGMNCMRIGEFAWSRMEPQEEQYDFEWLHLVVRKLGQAGIATIMGTPSATPPAWLAERYPEILAVDDRGSRAQHGARRHACPNSPVYRDHCARIAARMAAEFGRDPNVIGWQIDNEVYPWARGCCCPVCHRAFQESLRARFGTVAALNAAWCTDLWSQTYQSFSQIPIPASWTWHHPSLITAWMAFQGDSHVAFCGHQAAILHRLVRQPVGTDMMPFAGLNYHRMHRPLDVVQFNHYNNADNLWAACFWMDHCRPLKPAPFWNTETATCWNGSTAANGYREPGFCRANSWLPFALGGEANLYWLWRAHRAGQELMHGSVVSSCGRPLHVWDEVREIAADLKAAGAFIRATRPEPAPVALHLSTHAWWTFEFQPMVNKFTYIHALTNSTYRPLLEGHVRTDVIDPAADLAPYRVVLSPFLPWLGEEGLQPRLEKWIRAGGTWIAGPLTDGRNGDSAKYTHAPFGVLEDWAGVRCRYEIPGDPRQFRLDGATGPCTGSYWYDSFAPRGAETLATYREGPMDGLAAITTRRMGKGRIVLLGTMPEPAALIRLLAPILEEAGVEPAADASANLLAVPRSGGAARGAVVIELQNQPGWIRLPGPATDLISGRTLEGEVQVPPYGVLVLRSARTRRR